MSKKYDKIKEKFEEKARHDAIVQLLGKLDARQDQIIEACIEEVSKRVMYIFTETLNERVEREVMTVVGELVASRIDIQVKFTKGETYLGEPNGNIPEPD